MTGTQHVSPVAGRAGQQPHYPALDGLRGLAAIAVVLFHLGHWLNIPMLATNSGLAVDFFFCLSGYVLALSYGPRLAKRMTARRFVAIRLIRLLPLTVLGTVISASFIAARAVADINLVQWPAFAAAVALGIANLPYLDAPRALGGPQVFPLNGPQYSLFLEIVVNVAWAAVAIVRSPRISVPIIASGVIGIVILGFGGDTTNGFWSGFPRIFVSFFIGTMILRIPRGFLPKSLELPIFACSSATMLGMMFYPFTLPFVVRLIFVLCIAPLVVLSGARLPMTGFAQRIALFLGVISYPLYVLHFPIFVWLNGIVLLVAKHHLVALEVPAVLLAATTAAWLSVKYYDAPARSWLTQKMLASRRSLPSTAASPIS